MWRTRESSCISSPNRTHAILALCLLLSYSWPGGVLEQGRRAQCSPRQRTLPSRRFRGCMAACSCTGRRAHRSETSDVSVRTEVDWPEVCGHAAAQLEAGSDPYQSLRGIGARCRCRMQVAVVGRVGTEIRERESRSISGIRLRLTAVRTAWDAEHTRATRPLEIHRLLSSASHLSCPWEVSPIVSSTQAGRRHCFAERDPDPKSVS